MSDEKKDPKVALKGIVRVKKELAKMIATEALRLDVFRYQVVERMWEAYQQTIASPKPATPESSKIDPNTGKLLTQVNPEVEKGIVLSISQVPPKTTGEPSTEGHLERTKSVAVPDPPGTRKPDRDADDGREMDTGDVVGDEVAKAIADFEADEKKDSQRKKKPGRKAGGGS